MHHLLWVPSLLLGTAVTTHAAVAGTSDVAIEELVLCHEGLELVAA